MNEIKDVSRVVVMRRHLQPPATIDWNWQAATLLFYAARLRLRQRDFKKQHFCPNYADERVLK